ncbi:RNA polymerase sigma factor [Halopseudomonas sp.]|uniref:RNA polymerase sigma factor n=1 Tax=Halopseudomonas sp. TaxID=2901191 RepID=UPI00356537B0
MHQQLKQLIPGLRRFAYSLTGTVADADDLLQSTVEKLLLRAPPEEVELNRWAFRLCRNLWIDECRSRKVRYEAAQRPELTDGQWVDGERATVSQIQLEQVNAAMARLPDGQREIIAMVAVQGMSYLEVSEILEVPKGTVMSRLARARAALSDLMNNAPARALP